MSIDITNAGARTGSEIVQLYLHRTDAPATRPDQELRRFEKVTIDSGATRTVAFELDDRCFSEWHDGWQVMPGPFEVRVGRSSRDIRSVGTITPNRPYDADPSTKESHMAVTAYLFIETEGGKTAGVVTAIRSMDGVITADAITGPSDVIVRLETTDIDALGRMVVSEIQAVDGITRTQTCPVVNL